MSNDLPLVSVVLPVRNEAAFIEQTLHSVLQQDYPADRMEVIVVDGLSEDGTREIVERMVRSDGRVRCVDNPERIIPRALNRGIRAARGDILVRVDGHAVLPPDYVRECVAWLCRAAAESPADAARGSGPATRPPADGSLLAVGGAWDCVGRGWVGQAIARATSSPFGVGNAHYRTIRPGSRSPQPGVDVGWTARRVDTVPFWAMRREVFARLGLFREEMACHEDYEFNHRLREAGGAVWLLPWLRAGYFVRPTLFKLAAQYARYGFWKGRFLRARPGSLQFRHLIPPVFVAALVLTLLWAVYAREGRVALVALVGVYGGFLIMATAGMLLTAGGASAPAPLAGAFAAVPVGRTEGRVGTAARPVWSGLLLPGVLATLHLTWGAGVWAGLLRGKVRGVPPEL